MKSEKKKIVSSLVHLIQNGEDSLDPKEKSKIYFYLNVCLGLKLSMMVLFRIDRHFQSSVTLTKRL